MVRSESNAMSDRLPLVTIAIPTYNRAATYLPFALRSALAQDYPKLEIIVSDNASTDDTPALVRGFNDPRLRYVRHDPGIGGTNNWNYCVREAAGVYFLLLHDDDAIDPGFISSCIQASQGRSDLGFIRTGIRVIDGSGATLWEKENPVAGLSVPELFRAWFRNETAFYLPNTLFNTRALQELNGFHSKKYLFDDVVTVARLAGRYDRADVREIKASFRRHDTNLGANPNRVMDWAEDCIYLRDLLVEITPPDLKALMHREATAYLSSKAYKQAGRIPSLAARLRAYASIYARFGYRHAPIHILLSSARSRAKRGFRRLFNGSNDRPNDPERD
jgi:glycosyltransferase involved in cell wall biosynthesis